jgi:signal transduction histidine kinase
LPISQFLFYKKILIFQNSSFFFYFCNKLIKNKANSSIGLLGLVLNHKPLIMNTLYIKFSLLFIFLIILTPKSWGQDYLILTKDSTYCPLAKRVEILEDKSKQLTIKEIVQNQYQKKFQLSAQETPFHGYSASSFWFKFKVEAQKLPFGDEWFVQLQNPNIDTIEVYFLNAEQQIIKQYQTGDRFPYMQRPVTYYKFLFPIPFEKAEKITVYLCLKGHYAKNHNLDVVEKKTLLNIGQTNLSFYIFLKAILFTLLIYNFLLYTILRDIAYLYYVGYLFFALLYFLAADGFAVRLFYPNFPILSSYTVNVAGVYSLICLLWFAYHFLQIDQIGSLYPKRLIYGGTILGSAFLLLTIFDVWYIGSVPVLLLIVYLVGFGIFFNFTLGIIGLRIRFRQATFFLIATSFLFVGTLIFFVRRIGFEVPEILGENSFQIGMVLEGILLSFALADRIKIAHQEKRLAQQTAIEALQKNELIIKEQNKYLEQKVKERTIELEEKNEEIEQQNFILNQKSNELEKVNATKDKLFGIIGHDLRSPINSLKGLMDMLANQYISAEEFVMFSAKLQTGVEHAHFTLNNLLEWANSQMKGLVADPIMTNLAELGEENFNFLGQLASAKKIEMSNQIDPNLEAFIDPDQINLVFRNLISNAIKFTPENGKITLQSKKEADFCEIAITDTGVGMSDENVAKLFNKTTHFTTYGTANEKGTGLGLLLCQEMIEKNGGTIWAESEVGKGTAFKFRLPLQKR